MLGQNPNQAGTFQSGQMSNQGGSSLGGQTQNRFGNLMPGEMQNQVTSFLQQEMSRNYQMYGQLRNPRVAVSQEARGFMREKIYEFLTKRFHVKSQLKMLEIVEKLEMGLFENAPSQEEYLNLGTLESRLKALVRLAVLGNGNRKYSHVSSPSSIGTIIPTPGTSQSRNSSLISASAKDNSVGLRNNINCGASGTSYSVNLFPTKDGPTACGCGFSLSQSKERMHTQIMPTPGFSNAHNSMNLFTNNNSYTYNNVESTMASHPLRRKPLAGGGNSRILHNLGNHMGAGIKSPLQTSYGLTSGTLNGGVGNNIQLRNIPAPFEGCPTVTMSGNSARQLDQLQQPLSQVTSSVISGTSSPLLANQSNLHIAQHVKKENPLSVDQLLSYPSQSLFFGNLVQSHEHCQFQQQPHSQNKNQQNRLNQNHHTLLNNKAFGLSQLSSNIGSQLQSEADSDSYTEDMRSQAPEQLQVSNMPCQVWQNSLNIKSLNNQCPSLPSGPQISTSSLNQTSQQIPQMLHQDQFLEKPQSDLRYPFRSVQTDAIRPTQWYCKPQDESHAPVNFPSEPDVQQKYSHRITGLDETQKLNLSSYPSVSGQLVETPSEEILNISGNIGRSHSFDPKKQFRYQQRWLLYLHHAHRCPSPEGKCVHPHCFTVKKLLLHIKQCHGFKCPYSWCRVTMALIKHQRRCTDAGCPVCVPVKNYVRARSKANTHSASRTPSYSVIRCSTPLATSEGAVRSGLTTSPVVDENDMNLKPSLKRVKMVHSLQPDLSETETNWEPNSAGSTNHVLQEPVEKQSNTVIQCSTPLAPSEVAGRSGLKTSPVVDENDMNLEPSLKRVKMVHHSLKPDLSETETNSEPISACSMNHVLQEPVEKQSNTGVLLKSQTKDITMEFASIDGESAGSNEQFASIDGESARSNEQFASIDGESAGSNELNSENLNGSLMQRPNSYPCMPNSAVVFAQQESIKSEKDESEVKLESIPVPCENASGSKSVKPKVQGVSLIELFTSEQVHKHIQSLRQWVCQSKTKVEKKQSMGASMSKNCCQLCAVEKLTFEPPPIYCSTCGDRIKRNAMYYTIGAGDTRHWFCIHCHKKARGETIMVEKTPIPKARLEKKKNDEETEEWSVQCDKCEAWQHQICALFNGRRNDGGHAEYTCPNCYILEVERGERMPLPQNAVLGAKDLPRTILSDHIENRLARKLKQERKYRANYLTKSIDEVPGADGIVVRIVSSVDKKLEVKPQFLEIFKEENYPSEFPYKSKVLLVFQNIEGVEVCLFGMYVQEFGSECAKPNNRRVYLSYLDSVKYFRPEIKTISGESIRTYVYHEILIGYLEYCKKRGFASFYIWASPPLKGEDYILYCHPETQRTPKSDKLREWYLSMLRKAARENIVVEHTNLYDHFFIKTGECIAKVTASRLPYFDGDYWPAAAEDMIYQLQEEEEEEEEDEGRKQHKNGMVKKSIIRRALKAAGESDLCGNASKDLMIMHRLGKTIYAMREDFIMVHLQYSCTHCGILMVSRNRWVCNSCKTFNLCDKCYEAELKRKDRERHPINKKFRHPLYPVEIKDVPHDTKDEDEILESEFFDTPLSFLNLCQGNRYQYDTLRRAKHSSMMLLYYLHNPTVLRFVTQCVVCHLDTEAGQGWRCNSCFYYNVCNACYLKDGCVDHPHKLTNTASTADVNAQSKEARERRVTQEKKAIELMLHIAQCRSPQCNYPRCNNVKGMYHHASRCKVHVDGGCIFCQACRYMLEVHARTCKESQCNVPGCRDLRDHWKKLQQQSDSRRRATATEMMMQRAVKVPGSS